VRSRGEIQLDEFVVMPNHFHAVVFLHGTTSEPFDWKHRGFSGAPARSISSLVQGFKSSTARRINELRGTPGAPLWQRDYYERVLRSDRELERAREYILDNPRKWSEDKNNPANAA
jgi:REP element-mobilizing transposase RayT